MENGVLLTLTQTPQPTITTSSVFLQLDNNTTQFRFTSRRLRLSFALTRYTKWDSNADTLRARNSTFKFDRNDDEEKGSFSGNVKKKKKKRGWWYEKYGMRKERSRNLFDEAIESIWILKVFKSYGWLLPIIIISYLLATGPKAFFMALALSLGLSAFSLAFEKLLGKMQRRPKQKTRTRRKASYSNATSVEMNEEDEEEEEEEEQEESQEITNKKMGEFWAGSDNGSARKGSEDAPSFGGWADDLDGAGSMRRKSRVTGDSQRRQEDKLRGSERNSETPLLLRLLVAVFPFISSWAEMFW